MKIRCDIKGIDCPHCALELQNKMSNDPAIFEATINFPMQSLVMEVADDADEDEMEALAQKIADDFEDGITVELRD